MFRCKDLYTISSLSKLKLLAGNQGLHKGIRWVYKAESLHLSQWVHGGELLIISNPVTSQPEFHLASILEEAIELNMSGALLLIGPGYVETVEKSVLALCTRKDFPLFAIPWNLPLVDFFEEIGHAITNSTLHQNTREDIIFSIIFENYTDISMLNRQIADSGYTLCGINRFFLLHFSLPEQGQTAGMETSVNSNIEEYLRQVFLDTGIPLLTSTYTGHIIGMVQNDNTNLLTPVFSEILNYIGATYPELTCNIGIGLPVPDISHLKESYEQAAECITYCRKLQLKDQVLNFDQLGLYQLFSDIQKDSLLEKFVQSQIGPLLAYDEENHSQLANTLYAYLQHNCNILHTADALYTHRNTVKYRINRIEEILCKNTNSADDRLNLHLALYISRYVL